MQAGPPAVSPPVPAFVSPPVPALPSQSAGQPGQYSADNALPAATLFIDLLATVLVGTEPESQPNVAIGQSPTAAARQLANPLPPVQLPATEQPRAQLPGTPAGASQLVTTQTDTTQQAQQAQQAPATTAGVVPQGPSLPMPDLLTGVVVAAMPESAPGMPSNGAQGLSSKPAGDGGRTARPARHAAGAPDATAVASPATADQTAIQVAPPLPAIVPLFASATAEPPSVISRPRNKEPDDAGSAAATAALPASLPIPARPPEQSERITAGPNTVTLPDHDELGTPSSAPPVHAAALDSSDTAARVLSAAADLTRPAAASGSPSAVSEPALASPAHTASAASQVAPALVSLAHAPDGAQRLTLRLDPPELGQVQIRIERPQDAPARVEITVERQETLTLLLRDQPQLQRALDQAGIPADGRSVTFHMTIAEPAPRSDSAPLLSSGAGLAGQAGNGSDGAWRQGGNLQHQASNAVDDTDTEFTPAALPTWLSAGLDITA